MPKHTFSDSRRSCLLGLGAALAGGAAYATLPQLSLISRASAQTAGDYRALVCIFLNGGNDAYNTLIPYVNEEYDIYRATRGGVHDPNSNPTGLAIARDALLPITDQGGKPYGLHPSCAALKTLFDEESLSFVANVGTLFAPTTKADVRSRAHLLPPALRSHNDQQRQWRLGHPDMRRAMGWGGLVVDQLASLNIGSSNMPASISIGGTTEFSIGASRPLAVPGGGPAEPIGFRERGGAIERVRARALQQLVEANYESSLVNESATTARRSLDLTDQIRSAIAPESAGQLQTSFPATPLGTQLRMIARLIRAGRDVIGQRRQVYYASMGGFDTHGRQMEPGVHARLLTEVSEAMLAFRNALREIDAERAVMTFTMSEFARTLNSNGSGTDHAWGGVQWVMGAPATVGGSLVGGRVFGEYPIIEIEGPGTYGPRGNVIPTLSTQTFGASFGRWMGVHAGALPVIFPGLERFDVQDIGMLV